MRFLKKFVRKLYHLIWFLSLFVLFLIPNVKASSVNVSYPSLVTSSSNLTSGIQCNSTFCVNYNVPVRFDMDFTTQWGVSSSKTCSSQTSISGHINVQGGGELTVNPDWYASNLLRVYVNSNNVTYTCTYNTPSDGHIYYTCLLPSLSSSFNVGYVFKKRTTSTLYTNTTSIAYRDVEINCSTDSNENITYSTDRIINSQNNNTDRIINDNRRENDKTREKIEDNTDAINGLNDNLSDDTAPTIDLSDLEVSSDTPISDLITMPLTILNTLVQTLGGTCSNYTIPFFYNNSVTFPCFTISDYLGGTVTNYIDLFICFYMCYNIAMLVISVFEDITSLRDIYDSLYVPKHADTGYQPKHAKGGGN